MENIAPLFTHSLPPNPGKLLHSLHVLHPSEGDTTLQLYESCLL